MFRILCIDGGGMRGVIPAKVLALTEAELQRRGVSPRLADHFDLICGTSTGAIIAIGLGLGLPASQILGFYRNHAATIFPRRSMGRKLLRAARKGSFYDCQVLHRILTETYNEAAGGDTARLKHCHTRICIPSYDLKNDRLHLFRNYVADSPDAYAPASDVALASSSAPGLYTSHHFAFTTADGQEVSYSHLIDGGITANCPALLAYTEATRELGVPDTELAILSLGTGSCAVGSDLSAAIPGSYWLRHRHGGKTQSMLLTSYLLSAQAAYTDHLMEQLRQGAPGAAQPRFVYEQVQHRSTDDEVIPIDGADPSSLATMERIGEQLFDTRWLEKFFSK